jgi:hypothetical protein
MFPTLSETIQPRVVVPVLVDIQAAQIGKPCFDAPGRNEDRHPLIWLPHFKFIRLAGTIQFSYAGTDAFVISVDHNDQGCRNAMPIGAISPEFRGKSRPDELLGRAVARRTQLNPQPAR